MNSTESVSGILLGERLLSLDSQPRGQVKLQPDALTRHIHIDGTTGSGKSTTAKVICRGLVSAGVPALVFDRTGEYAEALEGPYGAIVMKPGENLSIALFERTDAELPSQIEDWISLLHHFYRTSYGADLTPLQARALRDVFSTCYHGTKETMTVSGLVSALEDYARLNSDLNGWPESTEATISRLWPLTVGKVGATFNRSYSTLKFEKLFEPKLTIIDLSVLPDDRARNLMSQVLLNGVYEGVRRRGKSEKVSLVALIDEAHHLAPNDEDYISIPERCAIELRKYGFSLITCATRPSLISPNIIANSNTLISHMLNNQSDIEELSEYFIGSSVKENLRKLAVGEALVQVNHPKPEPAVYCRVHS